MFPYSASETARPEAAIEIRAPKGNAATAPTKDVKLGRRTAQAETSEAAAVRNKGVRIPKGRMIAMHGEEPNAGRSRFAPGTNLAERHAAATTETETAGTIAAVPYSRRIKTGKHGVHRTTGAAVTAVTNGEA